MKDIYKKYFQKSSVFLYPLLGLKSKILPFKTYIQFDGKINPNDRKLICVYDIKDSSDWTSFELERLINHTMLEYTIRLADNKIAYIFDFNIPLMKEEFDIFIEGKYSQLAESSKEMIIRYFGKNTSEGEYIKSYIYPEKYFNEYSQFLLIDEERLKDVGELCDKVNLSEENCILQEI